MKLDVNTDAAIQLTAKLERLSKSAFPSAVRNTLNECAFDMKSKELPKSFKKNFKPKSGTISYFKKSLKVDKANGFNIKNMKSVVGLLDASNPIDRRFVEGMQKQEGGGIIDDGLRYLKYARGGRVNGRVISENRYDRTKVITGRSKRKGTRKSKFVARAYASLKTGKPIFMNTMRGNFLVKTSNVSSNISSKKLEFKFDFIAMSRKKVKTKLKSTKYNYEASIETFKKIEKFYKEKAEFQFKKYLK